MAILQPADFVKRRLGLSSWEEKAAGKGHSAECQGSPKSAGLFDLIEPYQHPNKGTLRTVLRPTSRSGRVIPVE